MVDIILATYNGDRFLAQQLDSILQQTCSDWRLIIRDDASQDRTPDIIKRYVEAHHNIFHVLSTPSINVGVVRNFEFLLNAASSPYVMFSDQDDVWLPDKITVVLSKIKELESIHGQFIPIAVYTDAFVVNENMEIISASLIQYIGRFPATEKELPKLLIAAACFGCTMIINRALQQMIKRMPNTVISHDWWAGMVAAACGVLCYHNVKTLRHRRHSKNQSFVRNAKWQALPKMVNGLKQHRIWMNKVFEQCVAFDLEFGPKIAPEKRLLFEDIKKLSKAGWFMKRYYVVKNGMVKTGLLRNIGYLLAL